MVLPPTHGISCFVSTVALHVQEVSTSNRWTRLVSTVARFPTGFHVRPCRQVSTVARSGNRGNDSRFWGQSGDRGNLRPSSHVRPLAAKFPRSPEGRAWKLLRCFHGLPFTGFHVLPVSTVARRTPKKVNSFPRSPDSRCFHCRPIPILGNRIDMFPR